MTIVTRRTLLLPYNESLKLEFVMLNCCAKNRAQLNGPYTVANAKLLFDKVLNDKTIHARAVLDNYNREYMGHVYIAHLDSQPELEFMFDKSYWGKGIASETLKAFVPKAMHELELESLTAHIKPQNIAAIKVLTKLGFYDVTQLSQCNALVTMRFTSDEVAGKSSAA
ncbi:N-acetyltransferase [Vibrio vulnificus]|uniref:GNAT family N-acetyltransferase n=1 Tax=Vibrio vulnificus TaxID=672 RepID=UPI0005036AF0|nr:GNAT family N-acetyltransferase [Vibrio vulnificus]EGQ7981563.1 GNAT family N-acetyltransferase [Vibrio vulnificus]EGQ9990431.1 GNAT family N-acetyltransferase [Vibrio vulnificus]EGR8989932.1 GNAT family N-acetyltransferase [Vibrio vulnificus]EID4418764.1 GNAT family N-acetyltransferase [Vibrio vulnificus]EIO4103453.1 GNAT family N-acetyltransferase [Vibrio vulnificus]